MASAAASKEKRGQSGGRAVERAHKVERASATVGRMETVHGRCRGRAWRSGVGQRAHSTTVERRVWRGASVEQGEEPAVRRRADGGRGHPCASLGGAGAGFLISVGRKYQTPPIKPKYREYQNFLFLFLFIYLFLIYFLIEKIFIKSISAGKKNLGPHR